jgi:hypothetical protein
MFETDLRATLAGSIRTVCFTSIPDIGSRISISDIQSITGIDPRSGIWIDQTTDRDLIYNSQLQGGLIYPRSDLRYRYRFSDIDPSQISIPTDIQTSDDVAINIVNMPWGGAKTNKNAATPLQISDTGPPVHPSETQIWDSDLRSESQIHGIHPI